VYKFLMGKPEGKRPFGRPRHSWEGGIRMDRREIGWGTVEWTQLAEGRDWWRALVNMVMNLWVLVSWSELVIMEGSCMVPWPCVCPYHPASVSLSRF
jgi:hypothetical protein